MTLRILATISALLLLGGCSGFKSYPDREPHNLTVRTLTDSGSAFSSVKANLEIYNVDSQCQLDYQGTVKLTEEKHEVGITTGRPLYLYVFFESSGFFSNRSSTIGADMLLTPRKGYHYSADVSYREDIYNVSLFEQSPRGKRRELNLPGIGSCKPKK